MTPRRRYAAALLAASVTGALGACATTPDAASPGHPVTITPTATPSQDPKPTFTPRVLTPAAGAPRPVPFSAVTAYHPSTADADGWFTGQMVGGGGTYRYRIIDPWGKPVTDLEEGPWAFGPPDTYTKLPGVIAFRGNNWRTAPSYGKVEVKDRKLTEIWSADGGSTSSLGQNWSGAGWSGQPVLVQWPVETKKAMGFPAALQTADGVEVIYSTFDGVLRRFDLATGTPTRPAIVSKGDYKGSASVDPRGIPLLYIGQGLLKEQGGDGWFYRMFDLARGVQAGGLQGVDQHAPRPWGAFDSSALVHGPSDTLYEPAENGLVYKVRLNATWQGGAATVQPVVTRLEYETPNSSKRGLESSAVAWKNLMYASDNDGNLLCWDMNTMALLWVRDVQDDADATMIVSEENGVPYLVHGNELDHRGGEPGVPQVTQIRKINGLTGEIVWQHDIPVSWDQIVNGGTLSSMLLGKGAAEGAVIVSVAKTPEGPRAGLLTSLDLATGKPRWERRLAAYTWSSPISVTATDGTEYGIFCDSAGQCHLFDVGTGADYATLDLKTNVEASPAAVNGVVVVASRSGLIHAFKVS